MKIDKELLNEYINELNTIYNKHLNEYLTRGIVANMKNAINCMHTKYEDIDNIFKLIHPILIGASNTIIIKLQISDSYAQIKECINNIIRAKQFLNLL